MLRPKKFIFGIAIVIAVTLLVFFRLRPPKKPRLIKISPQGEIAIVLDDWGYNLNHLHIVEQIRYPLTISVLPNLSYSKKVAEKLHELGFEIILHLPLEPHEKFRLEKDTIMVSMDEPRIRQIMENDLAGVPYAKGISNHMGSKASENARIMGIIFNELERRKLYFLDSLVSPKSVASVLAQEMKVLFSHRDIFLDNLQEGDYIKGQLRKLKNKARLNGQAVGIGHARKITLETLKAVMPQIEKEGFKFVFVSDLAS